MIYILLYNSIKERSIHLHEVRRKRHRMVRDDWHRICEVGDDGIVIDTRVQGVLTVNDNDGVGCWRTQWMNARMAKERLGILEEDCIYGK